MRFLEEVLKGPDKSTNVSQRSFIRPTMMGSYLDHRRVLGMDTGSNGAYIEKIDRKRQILGQEVSSEARQAVVLDGVDGAARYR
ncbi:hypothetical protein E2C01_030713 [Portunus trituberculatus]|uniref:Uncharacterized protein n=1 Tax=Portunus trituberculatus TaxID=210409 RepID=A0A5B7EW34_PORTR|nr:hypothetical protein [Portunus trituberculatus]